MKDWATEQFERAGLRFHHGKPKGEYPLNDLLKLLKRHGFTIGDQEGSHIVSYHAGLVGSSQFRAGTVTIVRKHPGSKSRPMTLAIYVELAWRAMIQLKQSGVLGNEPEIY